MSPSWGLWPGRSSDLCLVHHIVDTCRETSWTPTREVSRRIFLASWTRWCWKDAACGQWLRNMGCPRAGSKSSWRASERNAMRLCGHAPRRRVANPISGEVEDRILGLRKELLDQGFDGVLVGPRAWFLGYLFCSLGLRFLRRSPPEEAFSAHGLLTDSLKQNVTRHHRPPSAERRVQVSDTIRTRTSRPIMTIDRLITRRS